MDYMAYNTNYWYSKEEWKQDMQNIATANIKAALEYDNVDTAIRTELELCWQLTGIEFEIEDVWNT